MFVVNGIDLGGFRLPVKSFSMDQLCLQSGRKSIRTDGLDFRSGRPRSNGLGRFCSGFSKQSYGFPSKLCTELYAGNVLSAFTTQTVVVFAVIEWQE